MDPGFFIFWGGFASLFLVAAFLRYLDVDRMRARAGRRGVAAKSASPTAPGERKLVHTARRGRAKIMVWRIEGGRNGDGRHTLTVEGKNGECRDCISCVNEAIHWMQQHG
jgi:hypothetical protein